MTIENILFDVADALRYPVLIAALLTVVVVVLELGALLAEMRKRRGRGIKRVEAAVEAAKAALAKGDSAGAAKIVRDLGYNPPMSDALGAIVEQRAQPDAEDRIAKRLAEYDYRSMKRLERTRIMVRMGPALGLMGTLIPLSPALAALAEGDVQRLTEDLRVAFSVTVAGLLVGMIAFVVSLIRDRLYAQDYSDVEYVLAGLSGLPVHPSPRAPATGEAKVAATEVAQLGTVAVPPQTTPAPAPSGDGTAKPATGTATPSPAGGASKPAAPATGTATPSPAGGASNPAAPGGGPSEPASPGKPAPPGRPAPEGA